MTCMILVGGHYGDEGKGKVVSYLCEQDKHSIIARGGVGPNAGHSVVVDGKKYGIRMIPSGFVQKNARVLIGAGVLVNPDVLMDEIKLLEGYNMENRLGVDIRCGIITKEHIEADKKSEYLTKTIKTTQTGCGPANVERAKRVIGLAKDEPKLKEYLTDVSEEVNNALDDGENVLLEGTQGFGLSLFYGSYPYVTSKDTSASAVAMDVGVGPTRVDDVIVVFKAYTSRVGGGPFPTQISQEEAERLGIVEYGTVTGRRRGIGTFDFELGKKAVRINSATQVAVNCIDKMFPDAKGAKSWGDLPKAAKEHIEKIEKVVGAPVTLIGVGPEVREMIDLRSEKL
ncbi:MAG: adenylosuccinate synthetase [Candidatus Altiarchaeota archaeon]|nr:adenylosuccinate synthetase [Candidatus Altiarchaeota archaeon]